MPSIQILMNTVLKPLGIGVGSGSGQAMGLLLILTYP